ncbi:hypothetical protein [Variovorax boronicumulans]|uniref:hypothetical protein n=1 Tax=Variovorax boronicumulans TaxID=436515 RepID=UPI001112F54A|nr:hypothetical protein [Variovorax boronicumulans]
MNSSQIKKSRVAFFFGAVLSGHAAAAGCVSKLAKLLVPYPASGLLEGAEIGSRPSVGLYKVRAMIPIRSHSDAAPIAGTGKSSLVCGNHPGLLLHREVLRRND